MKNTASTNKNHKGRKKYDETSLSGTFVSVMIIAVFMILSWFSVFLLFLERN
ncbi:cytochrome c oxidase subunit 2A [Planococcus sp. SE5232]|uniref:cytochrome c oxidase subunit 2A n=1 Tax=unclassified Planococcus (in: firmicutes) TaxID=2662419 RepID=UPI001CBBDBED|nr:cytochrome c oxidase subunit 2A [Planococcus sp. 4-30]